jgi:REP element-mobilizing transposase RayT
MPAAPDRISARRAPDLGGATRNDSEIRKIGAWHSGCCSLDLHDDEEEAMSRARPIFPNTTYFETKRTATRELRFAGTANEREEIGNIVLYCLAHAAAKYGVDVHGITLMDNHPHTLYTDVEGRDPRFRQLKNSLIARAMNALQGRKGPFWASDRCVQVLADQGAVLDSYAYMAANPVKHGLVKRAPDFPGLRADPWRLEQTLVIKKPAVLFRSKNLPDQVRLTLTVPPALRHLPRHVGMHTLNDAAETREAFFRSRNAETSESYIGARQLLRTKPTDSPPQDSGEEPSARPRPNYIKCFDAERLKLLLDHLREFRQAFHDASARWGAGDTSACFPYGSWPSYLNRDAPIAQAP